MMNKNEYQHDKIIRENIGFFIRQSRLNKSLSGDQLGKLINVSQQQVSRYENGNTSLNIETLNTILKVLDVSWHDFFYKVLQVEVDDNDYKKINCHSDSL
ncbi:helix-turn-helix domain-containing protein [Providencia sp. Me31A]|uniref:helix-turn-helix domain-containing protein n=1 Tax=Providencia sp. Me31A TaxID=3392637 RepID=UPI003D2DC6B9